MLFRSRYAGALTGMFLVVLMFHGAFVNTRNIEVNNIELEVADLPAAFDGYKIIQISDIHLGSWGKSFSYMKPVIEKVNEQDADIVVFTGDMVNNFSQEMEGWQPYFNQLQSKSGKFAVLGNHDYGDYSDWKTPEEKNANFKAIKQNIRDFGFTLLTNEFVRLQRDSAVIELLGVGNWGKPDRKSVV